MARLTRAELQQRNRAKVLAAARGELAERGFRDAKVDGIAERAGLTRGAIYSNFPGKRALYFAVLADLAERASAPARPQLGHTVKDALGAFARAWMSRTAADLGGDQARLERDLMPEIQADERTRRAFTQLLHLDATLLGLALEALRPPDAPPVRLVRVAESALTILHGASQLAAAAPGFAEPYNVVSACEQLAGFEINDRWPPPAHVPPVSATEEPWSPPAALDAVRGTPADLGADGVVAFLGLNRLTAAEQAVRAAPSNAAVTVVLVTGDRELAPLARLTVANVAGCLRQAFPPSHLPRLQVVHDEPGTLARAAGIHAVSDETETAIRVTATKLVTRTEGRGASHAAATSAQDTRVSN